MSNFFKALANKPLAPIQKDAEYRLYYDKDTGAPISYSMEEMDGEFIIISKETFVQGKLGVQVVKGKLHKKVYSIVYKLVPNENKGTACYHTDISIVDITSKKYWGNKVKSEKIKC
jgi:hypothetical protein